MIKGVSVTVQPALWSSTRP